MSRDRGDWRRPSPMGPCPDRVGRTQRRSASPACRKAAGGVQSAARVIACTLPFPWLTVSAVSSAWTLRPPAQIDRSFCVAVAERGLSPVRRRVQPRSRCRAPPRRRGDTGLTPRLCPSVGRPDRSGASSKIKDAGPDVERRPSKFRHRRPDRGWQRRPRLAGATGHQGRQAGALDSRP